MCDDMVLFGLKVKDGRRWYSIDERDWWPMQIGDTVLSRFFWIPVADDENGAWSSYWMRLQPGARSFQHQHDSTELILILEGVFTEDDGTDFLPGHTVSYPAGSRHSTSSEGGCTVLVRCSYRVNDSLSITRHARLSHVEYVRLSIIASMEGAQFWMADARNFIDKSL